MPPRGLADCLVIGAGPAGMTAGLYLRRFHRAVTVVGGDDSRAALIPVSHNYPGFPDGIPGTALLERLRRQLAEVEGEVTTRSRRCARAGRRRLRSARRRRRGARPDRRDGHRDPRSRAACAGHRGPAQARPAAAMPDLRRLRVHRAMHRGGRRRRARRARGAVPAQLQRARDVHRDRRRAHAARGGGCAVARPRDRRAAR